MSLCTYEGRAVTPEMPGYCYKCSLYLNTCAPVIHNGYLTGAECDMDYCECCPVYSDCGMYFAAERSSYAGTY